MNAWPFVRSLLATLTSLQKEQWQCQATAKSMRACCWFDNCMYEMAMFDLICEDECQEHGMCGILYGATQGCDSRCSWQRH
jgi:hypothetical protein